MLGLNFETQTKHLYSPRQTELYSGFMRRWSSACTGTHTLHLENNKKGNVLIGLVQIARADTGYLLGHVTIYQQTKTYASKAQVNPD